MTVLTDSEIQKLHGGTGDSGYWFKEKDFVGPTFQTVNFWVHGVALKTAPCILLTVLSALLIRAMRAAEIRHRRLVQRTPVRSSVSASPRMDTQTCTVRRHHTFEETKTSSQSELNGSTLRISPSTFRRSFSERLTRSPARPAKVETIRLEKIRTSAHEVQETRETIGTAIKKGTSSTVIAQTVGGDVVVELTSVDDEISASEHHPVVQDEVGPAKNRGHAPIICLKMGKEYVVGNLCTKFEVSISTRSRIRSF